MIDALIYLIIAVIVLGFIWWAIQQLLPLVPLAEPFRTILRVLMTLLMVLIVLWVIVTLLRMLGIGANLPLWPMR